MTDVDHHTRHSTGPPAGGVPERGGSRWPRAVAALAAAGLAAAAALLPLWHTHLSAPQYPEGLRLVVYGHDVSGDVDEIGALNHYVGMRAFDPADVPEMALWPLALALAVAAVAVSGLAGRRVVGRLARAYLWLFPLGVLTDIQLRLYQYGHDLDPGAAFRIPEFTPRVVGPTEVMNFHTWSYPGLGVLALLAAAALATFGPRLLGRVGGRRGPAAAALALLVITVAPLPSASAAEHGTHEHGSHGHGDEPSAAKGSPASTADPPLDDAGAARPAAPIDLATRLHEAVAGERVIVPPGVYTGNLTIDVPVRLEGRGLPLVQGDGTGSVITVRAPGTVITGLVVRGSGPGPLQDPAGIRIEAEAVRIEGVLIDDVYTGIHVAGAGGIHLVGNTIRGRTEAGFGGDAHAVGGDDHAPEDTGPGAFSRGDGISLWNADGVLVRGNHIHDVRDGVYVSYGSEALIDGNHITGSRYAIHTMSARDAMLAENTLEGNLSGAVLMYGGPVVALRNTVADNRSPSTGFGILVKDVTGGELVENVLTGNHVGLHLDGATQAGEAGVTRVRANTVHGNVVGVALYPSAHGRFSANSFVDNQLQVLPKGGATAGRSEWSEGAWGNYWSTYRGYESSALPGHGAVPHGEGGGIERLLVRSPVLGALATSPGLRLLRALEDRWTRRTPVLVDDLPLTRPLSPPLAGADPQAPPALAALGGAAVLLLVVAVVRLRRPGAGILEALSP